MEWAGTASRPRKRMAQKKKQVEQLNYPKTVFLNWVGVNALMRSDRPNAPLVMRLRQGLYALEGDIFAKPAHIDGKTTDEIKRINGELDIIVEKDMVADKMFRCMSLLIEKQMLLKKAADQAGLLGTYAPDDQRYEI